jgi:hypothetical protein
MLMVAVPLQGRAVPYAVVEPVYAAAVSPFRGETHLCIQTKTSLQVP